MAYVMITPRDPLVFRDGRPFNPDGFNLARTLPWPFPSTIAGAVRTVLGKLAARDGQAPFGSEESLEALRAVEVSGAFLLADSEVYLPCPADAVGRGVKDSARMIRLEAVSPSPLGADEGCNLPHSGVWPVVPRSPEKAEELPRFWSLDRAAEWLAGGPCEWQLSKNDGSDKGFIRCVPVEERVHVSIDPRRQAVAGEGSLFVTRALAFKDGWSMVVRVEPPVGPLQEALRHLPGLHALGGERRLAVFDLLDDKEPPGLAAARALGRVAPDRVKVALAQTRGVRMLLVTPVPFGCGWLPRWLDSVSLEGSPPGFESAVRLRLRGACLDRWVPVSGWSLERHRSPDGRVRKPGPKPVRRAVPQGAVYFFEVVGGSAARLAEAGWLVSVADEPQDRADGFGLAAWGSWGIQAS